MRVYILSIISLSLSYFICQTPQRWTDSIFDGKTLNGWTQLNGTAIIVWKNYNCRNYGIAKLLSLLR